MSSQSEAARRRGIPRIGMRIIKSAIVMFLCFVIYRLRGQEGLPFYSGIAAIICMQAYVSNSLKMALDRSIGTFIGGIAGGLFLLADRQLNVSGHSLLLHYLFISLLIIPLIYSTVLIHRPAAAVITCVVFVSIAISHGEDTNAFWLAGQRMLDTLIGIFVSLGVNAFKLPWRAGRHTLFVSDLDGTLLGSEGELGATTVVKLNQMLDSGAHFTIATNRTPGSFLPLLEEVHLRLPVIAMNGAALYNIAERKYESCRCLSPEAAARVRALFEQEGHNLFVNVIVHDVLHVYHGEFTGPVGEVLCRHWRNLPGKYYILSPPPADHPILYLTAVDEARVIGLLRGAIDGLADELGIYTVCTPSPLVEGAVVLDIYSREASRKNAMLAMKQTEGVRAVAFFGNSDDDIPLAEAADVSFAVAEAADGLKAAAGHVLGSRDNDAPARTMHRLYYWQRIKTPKK